MAPVVAARIAAAMLILPAFCPGQDSGRTPHFSGQAPHEAQELLHKVEGTIIGVDTKAMTLTIRAEGKLATVQMTSDTKFSRDERLPAATNELKAGQTVDVIIKIVRGQPEMAMAVHLKSK